MLDRTNMDSSMEPLHHGVSTLCTGARVGYVGLNRRSIFAVNIDHMAVVPYLDC
jgi:hypothetical protein